MDEIILPEGWVLTTIDDISVKCEQRKPISEENFFYIDIGCIDRVQKKISNPKFIEGKSAPSRARKIINLGDILVSLTRPNLNAVAHVGKEFNNQIASTGFEVIKPLIVENSYIFGLVRSQNFINAISGKVQGALYPAAKSIDVRNYMFPLPPLAEQKQIAAKLDELLAQVDTLKTRLDTIPTILKCFRQSVLASASSGKLTEEWRENNECTPVSTSLNCIKQDRENVLGVKKKAVNHLKAEEYFIPNAWQWVSLDSLAIKIVDGAHHTPVYVESGVPFISVKDVKNGRINFTNTKFISEEQHAELIKRCNPEVGDLLITKSGTIGRMAIIKTHNKFSLFVSVALIKPASKKINVEFIDIALQKWINEIDISSRIVGTAIKNLHLRDMRVLAIPFPSIEEQTEIVRRAKQFFVFAEQIEQRVKGAQQKVNNLSQSILAKAFRGELTKEWRKQNHDLISGESSAKALLEKIKAEREQLIPKKRAVKKKNKAKA